MSKRGFVKNISWVTVSLALERLAGLAQTVLLARALGITEYGVFGLLFGTIGFVGSMAGIQMGLTATVFVARYKDADKEKARYVVDFVRRFGWIMGVSVVGIVVVFAPMIATWLIGPDAKPAAIILSAAIVAVAIITGIQDGVIQGFEDFRSLTVTRLLSTIVTLGLVYPAGLEYGLTGALVVMIIGPLVKYVALLRRLSWHMADQALPASGSGISATELIWGFSVPAMLVSLLIGFVNWASSVALSRQADGFEVLAQVNVGLQWRGPILLLAVVVGSVAIPALSRQLHTGDVAGARRLRRQMLVYTGGIAFVTAAVLALASPIIMNIYGPGFLQGGNVFSLLVISAVPQVVANVYLQHIVARGRLWYQLRMHLWLILPLSLGYLVLIPRFGGLGFAGGHLFGWSVFALALLYFQREQPDSGLVPSNLDGRDGD